MFKKTVIKTSKKNELKSVAKKDPIKKEASVVASSLDSLMASHEEPINERPPAPPQSNYSELQPESESEIEIEIEVDDSDSVEAEEEDDIPVVTSEAYSLLNQFST